MAEIQWAIASLALNPNILACSLKLSVMFGVGQYFRVYFWTLLWAIVSHQTTWRSVWFSHTQLSDRTVAKPWWRGLFQAPWFRQLIWRPFVGVVNVLSCCHILDPSLACGGQDMQELKGETYNQFSHFSEPSRRLTPPSWTRRAHLQSWCSWGPMQLCSSSETKRHCQLFSMRQNNFWRRSYEDSELIMIPKTHYIKHTKSPGDRLAQEKLVWCSSM